MNLDLKIRNEEFLDKNDKKEIEIIINEIIENSKKDINRINELALESISALTISEARSKELNESGIFKTILGKFSGKNKKLRNEVNMNLIIAQYSSQKIIEKLANQNLLNLELIVIINNKLNSFILEVNEEINDIYKYLQKFFKQIKSNMIDYNNRIEKVENNVKVLNFNVGVLNFINTIQYKVVDGIDIEDMDINKKIFYLIKDFFEITEGEWKLQELLLLNKAVENLNLSIKDKINLRDFISFVTNDEEVYNWFANEYRNILNEINLNSERNLIKSIIKVKVLGDEEELNFYEEIPIVDFIIEVLYDAKVLNQEGIAIALSHGFKNIKAYDILKAAKDGNVEAQYELANMYYNGENVEIDYKKAIEWYKLSAEKGLLDSQLKLGDMYYSGINMNKNLEEAVKWYSLAAKNGDLDSQMMLGDMYYNGKKVGINYKKAEEFYKLAAKNLSDKAQCILGDMYFTGKEIRWYMITEKEFEDRYKLNKEDVQKNMGRLYIESNAVKKSYCKAIKYYKLSAEQGNSEAQYKLADIYKEGVGVEKDFEEAERLYTESAKTNSIAQIKLADFLKENVSEITVGMFLIKNNKSIEEYTLEIYKKILKYYELAAKQEISEAEYKLGDLYCEGKIIKQDYKEAFKWYNLSANHGNALGQFNLANMYYYGLGVGKDFEKAKSLYEESRKNGCEEARYKLMSNMSDFMKGRFFH